MKTYSLQNVKAKSLSLANNSCKVFYNALIKILKMWVVLLKTILNNKG